MQDVFIAHVEEDSDIALEIALYLEHKGYKTWTFEVDSIPGPSYLLQTGQAVENAKAVIVIISPHSLGSKQVTKEVVRAHEAGKDFTPVRRDISHIEFQNRQPEWREAIGAASSIAVTAGNVENVVNRIIEGLNSLGITSKSEPDKSHIARISQALESLGGPLPVARISQAQESLGGPLPVKKPEVGIFIPEESGIKSRKRGAWFWVGVILLSVSALWWLILFLSCEGMRAVALAVMTGVLTTMVPVGIGIYGVRRGRDGHLLKRRKFAEKLSHKQWRV